MTSLYFSITNKDRWDLVYPLPCSHGSLSVKLFVEDMMRVNLLPSLVPPRWLCAQLPLNDLSSPSSNWEDSISRHPILPAVHTVMLKGGNWTLPMTYHILQLTAPWSQNRCKHCIEKQCRTIRQTKCNFSDLLIPFSNTNVLTNPIYAAMPMHFLVPI